MRPFSDRLNFFKRVAAFGSCGPELLFDDEPIDHLLYGKGDKGPTSASIFTRSIEYLNSIREAHGKGEMHAVIDCGTALIENGCLISIGACFELAGIMVRIVPQVPNPIMQFDLSPLGSLLEKIWEIAIEKQNRSLKRRIGPSLYRWHEHHKHYEQAREILGALVEIHVRQGNHSEEAAARNNLAFEYLLEGRFLEAIPGFEASAKLFEDTGEEDQCANARANSWICRFETGGLEDIRRAESELQNLAEILDRKGMWQVRKPLVLLARIAEKRGEIQRAIELVNRAIKACRSSGTRYPEMDAKYLAHLQALPDKPGFLN